jgi:hypothetical protein
MITGTGLRDNTLVAPCIEVIWRVASTPPITGISRSMNTQSKSMVAIPPPLLILGTPLLVEELQAMPIDCANMSTASCPLDAKVYRGLRRFCLLNLGRISRVSRVSRCVCCGEVCIREGVKCGKIF